MKVSQNNQGLQKTKYLGSSAENRVELEDKQRAHRKFSATTNGETSEFQYGSLERMLSINNVVSAIQNSFGFRPRRDAKGAIKKAPLSTRK
ncbi:MAG: hypothetical protein E7208_12775 [Clostridium butyricum]|nr:hypothetical protein [Clostridium butyricum]